MELIAPEEIATAIHSLVEVAFGVAEVDVAPAVCRMFGFARCTGDMVRHVNELMGALIKSSKLEDIHGQIQLPKT